MRMLRGMYANRKYPGRPKGGLNLHRLVLEALALQRAERVLGGACDVISLVVGKAKRAGFDLPSAAVEEAFLDLAG